MGSLIVLVGPPGSGKSTLAKELCIRYRSVYINQDSQGKEHLNLFTSALSMGQSIVVDRMGFSKQQRDRYLNPAKAAGYETHIMVLHQPYKVCLERIRARKDHETIKDEESARSALGTFFGKYERPLPGEADKIDFIYPDSDYKPPVVVCDLDGTLCNIEHRLHLVRKPSGEKKDWPGFFRGLKDDTVNKWCVTVLKGAVTEGSNYIFCSGRPDNYRRETQAWLDDHDFPLIPLFMRPRNDQREDSIIKEIILDFEILTRYTPVFMIDDRKRVVDMWRRRGFVCLHCAEGDF